MSGLGDPELGPVLDQGSHQNQLLVLCCARHRSRGTSSPSSVPTGTQVPPKVCLRQLCSPAVPGGTLVTSQRLLLFSQRAGQDRSRLGDLTDALREKPCTGQSRAQTLEAAFVPEGNLRGRPWAVLPSPSPGHCRDVKAVCQDGKQDSGHPAGIAALAGREMESSCLPGPGSVWDRGRDRQNHCPGMRAGTQTLQAPLW